MPARWLNGTLAQARSSVALNMSTVSRSKYMAMRNFAGSNNQVFLPQVDDVVMTPSTMRATTNSLNRDANRDPAIAEVWTIFDRRQAGETTTRNKMRFDAEPTS